MRERVRGEERSERAGGAGTREARQHGDAHGAGGEDEDEEDAVGGEEPVRLDAAPELPRDHDADRGREARDDRQRERSQETAGEGAPGDPGARLRHARKRTSV